MFRLRSTYLLGLSTEHKALYTAKLEHLEGLDPYTLKQADLITSLDEVPKVTKSRILDFLLFKTSAFTQKELQAHKSLEAYIQFACKWVQSIGALKIGDNYLILITSISDDKTETKHRCY